ncbi:hypothetical protein F5148DRAFT_1279662 [Russula earlei]|uniref:Uncharacterized protein n=1 Tax=Russula earlei TaxID=71964 RepID=A0ACC0ULN0_9AGAM|nr:hypothetical protein F5148DRAFT_1279662 [Russula earlei]
MIPTPSSSRPWWSRSSVISSKSSSSSKQQQFSQGSKSPSKRFNTIATAIGLRPKKSATPVQEPTSPVLPLHTGDIESPPRPTKSLPEDFLDAYPQSVYSTDLDPFATAAKYPDGPPNVSDSLRFSTISEVSTLESHVRTDPTHVHKRMSFASSSSLSHQRSDVTSDSSPFSSPLMSPVMPSRRLSRLTLESERVLMREHFPPSPVSPQSLRGCWDDRSCIASSPSSTTLTDVHGRGAALPRRMTWSRGFADTSRSENDLLASDRKGSSLHPSNALSPRVVIRQPSSSKLQPLRPPTAPPASELPPAPQEVQQQNFSLLPAFLENTSQSATSSSSSLSFASSTSSKIAALETEGRQRDIRRFKDAKKPSKSRPHREFSSTRSLKKAISIQNLPKRSLGNNTSPSLPAAEDTKSVKKQRSFHHSRIPIPPLPTSLKQTGSSNSASGRDAPPISEGRRANVQSSQKSPLSSPALSPTNVRKRLFSGTSLRRSTSSQTPEPDDDTPSIASLSSTASPLSRPQTVNLMNQPSDSNKPQLSSFWDDRDELPYNPGSGNRPRDLGPQQILSAADILKFENMVRDGGNLSEFVYSREDALTSSKRSAPATHAPASSVASSPSTFHYTSIRLQWGKVGDVTNSRSQTGGTSLGQAVRSQSFQSLHGLPLPPRQRLRPSTASRIDSPTIEDSPLLAPGDRSSVIALVPLSPPPVRRNVARRTLDPPPAIPILRPAVSRTPSFLDMRDDVDRDLSPREDSFLDMGKASLDTVRSSMEEDPALS